MRTNSIILGALSMGLIVLGSAIMIDARPFVALDWKEATIGIALAILGFVVMMMQLRIRLLVRFALAATFAATSYFCLCPNSGTILIGPGSGDRVVSWKTEDGVQTGFLMTDRKPKVFETGREVRFVNGVTTIRPLKFLIPIGGPFKSQQEKSAAGRSH